MNKQNTIRRNKDISLCMNSNLTLIRDQKLCGLIQEGISVRAFGSVINRIQIILVIGL